MTRPNSLAVVIVTFNRRADLKKTLTQLASMQDEFEHLVVVDNCSTDATLEMLKSIRTDFHRGFHIEALTENTGGAGGFHAGLRAALQLPVDWIWMSDDDALPKTGALRIIMEAATDEHQTYGSTAIVKGSETEELCWPAPNYLSNGSSSGTTLLTRDQMAPLQHVQFVPFLGLMVSRKTALKVGLPNRSYFISGDDYEYCIRLEAAGSRIIQVRDSVVVHPAIPRYHIKLLNRRIACLEMPAWRRYYDIRNRIWNSHLKGGFGAALLTAAVLTPRIVFTFTREKDLSGQFGAYLRGIWHGLFRYKLSKSEGPV